MTETNTEVYRSLFGVYPDDLIKKTEDVENFKKMMYEVDSKEDDGKKRVGEEEARGVLAEDEIKKKKAEWRMKYQTEKQKIVGYAVEFPLSFLEEEDLREFKHFEFGLYMLPPHIFT